MVPRGLEPRTLRLLAVRSNQLSYETTAATRMGNSHIRVLAPWSVKRICSRQISIKRLEFLALFDQNWIYIIYWNEKWQLWGSNPRPCGLAPEASALDHSAKLSWYFQIIKCEDEIDIDALRSSSSFKIVCICEKRRKLVKIIIRWINIM